MKSSLEHKGAVLNLLDATLTWNSQQIELTKNELKILQTLMEHKEKIVSREEPQYIWLGIRDTGIGIRSEDIPRVFEKGYTGFNGHEDKRSTGIGLYLCREVLQKLGHTIQIQSEMGEGTNVRGGFSRDVIDSRD